MRRILRSLLVACLGAALLVPGGAVAADPPLGQLLAADDFTDTAGPLEEGELELAVLSSRAATVTGGTAMLGVRGVDEADEVALEVDGRDVTEAFTIDPSDGALVGVIEDLVEGENTVRLIAEHPEHGRRGAELTLVNHPITGPVFSGPHQEPFVCRTTSMGLGEPIDDDCSIGTRVQWFAFDLVGARFVELDDPFDGYPTTTGTTVTTDGEVVPYVVRVETSTINRGVTRIAVLDDPAARGPDAPFEPTEAWNGRMLHQWGASCGVGRHQGTNSVDSVLTGLPDGTGSSPEGVPAVPLPPVGDGYLVAHSTLTTLGVHCNPVLSAETFGMIREHVFTEYGRHDLAIGSGASGGAIQQVTTMDNYPGILDGGVPMITFPDVVTTAMSPADCRLLLAVFEDDPDTWTERKRTAVSGHLTSQICRDWDDMFADHLVASTGCHGSVRSAPEGIYDPETNPDGVRCTLQDALVNVMGVDEETGFARRPVDNTGVQYGRQAFEDGVISAEEFVRLNEQVGGFDLDGNPAPQRMDMGAELARTMYEVGAVTGRGALADAPLIFTSTYVDPVPILGFHDAVRAYQTRARLERHAGRTDTHAIWSGAPLPNDAWKVVDEWVTDLRAARDAAGGVREAGWSDQVADARPFAANDGCVVTTAGLLPGGVNVPLGGSPDDVCEQAFRPLGSPRTVAGGPLAEDVIKCTTRPADRAIDGVGMDDPQWGRFLDVFGDTGVCDFDQPGVGDGEVERSATWLSYGNADAVFETPVALPNLVARTTVLEPDGDEGDDELGGPDDGADGDEAPGRSGDRPGRSDDAPGRDGDGPGRSGDGPGRSGDAGSMVMGTPAAAVGPLSSSGGGLALVALVGLLGGSLLTSRRGGVPSSRPR